MLDPGRTLLAGWCKWLMVNFQLSYWHRTNGAVRYILVNNSRVNVKWYGRIKVYACVCTADCHLVNSLQDMKDLCDGYSMIVASRFMFDLFGWFPCTEQWTLLSKINMPSLWKYMWAHVFENLSPILWLTLNWICWTCWSKIHVWFSTFFSWLWRSLCMGAPLLGCHASKRAVHGPNWHAPTHSMRPRLQIPNGFRESESWRPPSSRTIRRPPFSPPKLEGKPTQILIPKLSTLPVSIPPPLPHSPTLARVLSWILP
jgi:hypothetical protein